MTKNDDKDDASKPDKAGKVKSKGKKAPKISKWNEAESTEQPVEVNPSIKNKTTEEIDVEDLNLQKPSTSQKRHGNYFNDGKRRIDYIICYTTQSIQNTVNNDKITSYVMNLQKRGLQVEQEFGQGIANMIFIKIHGPDDVLNAYASSYNIELTCTNHNFTRQQPPRYNFMRNALNTPIKLSSISARSNSVSGHRPTSMTDAERTMIVYRLLSDTTFGSARNEIGIVPLIKKKVIVDGYALHDEQYFWTQEGPLSDRQLLAKYWATIFSIFQQQPLNLIEQYFGTDNALYYAWIGFYNRMLIVASIGGLIFFLAGVLYFQTAGYTHTVDDVCNSKKILCPACHHFKYCPYQQLNSSCHLMIVSHYFDNTFTIVFAIFMSLWSTIFIALWKRRENKITLSWNIKHLDIDTTLRFEFLEAATKNKISNLTGEMVSYVPTFKKTFHLTFTYFMCLILVVTLFGVMFGLIVYRVGVKYSLSMTSGFSGKAAVIASTTGSLLIYCFIHLFGKVYEIIAMHLTRFEYHRTQLEHDNSYIYKMCVLSFANNYSAISYLAFFKGKFYTYPGEQDHTKAFFGLGEDQCEPAGCLIDLTIQLMLIMVSKSIVSCLSQLLFPLAKYRFNKFYYHTSSKKILPHWENEFVLNKTTKYYLIQEWNAMVIQYGFVTFFVAAFPLAPLVALINNLIELRIDAFKMTTLLKRPVGHRTPGIGPYRGILKAMTIIGIATNAFVIAFTTDCIPRARYLFRKNKHFRKESLSKFAIRDYKGLEESSRNVTPPNNVTSCFYPGKRYPPTHPNKYQLTEEFWIEMAIRLAFILAFEHILISFTGVLSYAIPEVPYSVKMIKNLQETEIKEAKREILNINYEKKRKGGFLWNWHTEKA